MSRMAFNLDDYIIDCLFPAKGAPAQTFYPLFFTRIHLEFWSDVLFHYTVAFTKLSVLICLPVMICVLVKKSLTVTGIKQKMSNNNAQSNVVDSVKSWYKDSILNTPCSLWFSKLIHHSKIWTTEYSDKIDNGGFFDAEETRIKTHSAKQKAEEKTQQKHIDQQEDQTRGPPVKKSAVDELQSKETSQISEVVTDSTCRCSTKDEVKKSVQSKQTSKKQSKKEDIKNKPFVGKGTGERNSKNKKVYSRTRPFEVDQLTGEMCVCRKKVQDIIFSSETFYKDAKSADKISQANLVAPLHETTATLVQANTLEKHLVIEAVAGRQRPLEIILRKSRSSLDVDEATSDLMIGDINSIREKYAKNTILISGDSAKPVATINTRPKHEKSAHVFQELANTKVIGQLQKGAVKPQTEKIRPENRHVEQQTEKNPLREQLQQTDEIEDDMHSEELSERKKDVKIQEKPQIVNKHLELKQCKHALQVTKRQAPTTSMFHWKSRQGGQLQKHQLSKTITENKAANLSLNLSFGETKNTKVFSPTTSGTILEPSGRNTQEISKIVLQISHEPLLNKYLLGSSKDILSTNINKKNNHIFNDIIESCRCVEDDISAYAAESKDHVGSSKSECNGSSETLFNVSPCYNELTSEPLQDSIADERSSERSSHTYQIGYSHSYISYTYSSVSSRPPKPIIKTQQRDSDEDESSENVTYTLDSADSSSSDVRINNKEYRHVNGPSSKVLGSKPPMGKQKTLPEKHLCQFKPIETFPSKTKDFNAKFNRQRPIEQKKESGHNKSVLKTKGHQEEVTDAPTSESTVTRTLSDRSYQSIFGCKLPRRIIPKDNTLNVRYNQEKQNQVKGPSKNAGYHLKGENILKQNAVVCRPSSKPLTGQLKHPEELSVGTTTADVFNCLIDSADKLNTIYTLAKVRSHVCAGVIRNKLNNTKFHPYVIPIPPDKVPKLRTVFNNQPSKTLHKPNIDHIPSSANRNLPKVKNAAFHCKERFIGLKPLRAPTGSKTHKQESALKDKKITLVSKKICFQTNPRLLQQRPAMSRVKIPPTIPENVEKLDWPTNYRWEKSYESKTKRTNVLEDRRLFKQDEKATETKAQKSEPIKALSNVNKALESYDNHQARKDQTNLTSISKLVFRNREISKNVCMIESLQPDLSNEMTQKELLKEHDKTSKNEIETPLNTVIEDKMNDTQRVPTPTLSYVDWSLADKRKEMSKGRKLNNETPDLSCLRNIHSLDDLSALSTSNAQDVNIPQKTSFRVIKTSQENGTPPDDAPQKTTWASSLILNNPKSKTDTEHFLTNNQCKSIINEKSTLSTTFWTSNVHVTPMLSPPCLHRREHSLLVSDKQTFVSDTFDQMKQKSTHFPQTHLSESQSVNIETAKQVKTNKRQRPSRIPRYIQLQRSSRDKASVSLLNPDEKRADCNNIVDAKKIDAWENKKNEKNNSPSSPKLHLPDNKLKTQSELKVSKSPRSPSQGSHNISFRNSDSGLKHVLPLLMDRVQDSIIIITPEKKVKNLNLIMSKCNKMLNTLENSSETSLPMRKTQYLERKKIGEIEFHQSNVDKTNDSVPRKRSPCPLATVEECNEVKEAPNKSSHDAAMQIPILKESHVCEELKNKDIDKFDETSLWVNKKQLRTICSPESCRLCGTHTAENVTCDMGNVDLMTSHQQYTMKMSENLVSCRKLIQTLKQNEAAVETTNAQTTASLRELGGSKQAEHISARQSVSNRSVPSNIHSIYNNTVEQIRNCSEKKVKPNESNPLQNCSYSSPCSNITNAALNASSENKLKKASNKSGRLSGIPRLKKHANQNRVTTSKMTPDNYTQERAAELPVKVLTCEDYCMISRDSGELSMGEKSFSKKQSIQSNERDNTKTQASFFKPKIKEKIVQKENRKNLALRTNVTFRNGKKMKTSEDAHEQSVSTKNHEIISKRKLPKYCRFLEKKYTIHLDTAKPTASYPVCGSLESQSLNNTSCERTENYVFINKTEGNKTKKNRPESLFKLHSKKFIKDEMLLPHPKRRPEDLEKRRKKYQAMLPATKWRTDAHQTMCRQKANTKILDQLMNQYNDSYANTKVSHQNDLRPSSPKGILEKKTENLLRGKASHKSRDPLGEQEPKETKPTKTKATNQKVAQKAHDAKTRKARNHKGKPEKSRTLHEILHLEELPTQDSNASSHQASLKEEKKSRESVKKHNKQKQMFFSDQSPMKVSTKLTKKNVSALSVSTKSDITERKIKRPTHTDEDLQTLDTHKIKQKASSLRKVMADSSNEHNSRECDRSTTMPTTEADMHVSPKPDKKSSEKKIDFQRIDKEETVTEADDGNNDKPSFGQEILSSEPIQKLLKDIHTNEQDALIQRLKLWIQQRQSHSDNESMASTDTVIGREIEHLLKILINSLDPNKRKQMYYSTAHPIMEPLDRILEEEEKSQTSAAAAQSDVNDTSKERHRKATVASKEENSRHFFKGERYFRKATTSMDLKKTRLRRPGYRSGLHVRDARIRLFNQIAATEALYQEFKKMREQQFGYYENSDKLSLDAVSEDRRERTAKKGQKEAFTESDAKHLEGSPNLSTKADRNTSRFEHYNVFTSRYCNRNDWENNDLARHYPSASTVSCFEVGATYAASAGHDVPVQTSSQIVYKKRGKRDESLRSLPGDLLMASSTYSGPWSPVSRGQLSDFMKTIDLGHANRSYNFFSQDVHKEGRDGKDDKCSNSSAEIILSWLARTPDIDISVDRGAVRKENSPGMTRGDNSNASVSVPLPLATTDEVITDETSSPWLENLRKKSVSPLNLKDLDCSLATQCASFRTRARQISNMTDNLNTWPVVKSVLRSSTKAEADAANPQSALEKEKRTYGHSNHKLDRPGRKLDYTSENRNLKKDSGVIFSRKEQNESFNNRLGKNRLSKLRYNSSKRQQSFKLECIHPPRLNSAITHTSYSGITSKCFGAPMDRLELADDECTGAVNYPNSFITLSPSNHGANEVLESRGSLISWGNDCTTRELFFDSPETSPSATKKNMTANCAGEITKVGKAELSLEYHMSAQAASCSERQGTEETKKSGKSDESTVSRASLDWYKPSTLNNDVSSRAPGPESSFKINGSDQIGARSSFLNTEGDSCPAVESDAPLESLTSSAGKREHGTHTNDTADAGLTAESNEALHIKEKHTIRSSREHEISHFASREVNWKTCEYSNETLNSNYHESQRKNPSCHIQHSNSRPVYPRSDITGDVVVQDIATSSLCSTSRGRNEPCQYRHAVNVFNCDSDKINLSKVELDGIDIHDATRRHQEYRNAIGGLKRDRKTFMEDVLSKKSTFSKYELRDRGKYCSFTYTPEVNRGQGFSSGGVLSTSGSSKSLRQASDLGLVSRTGYRYKTLVTDLTHLDIASDRERHKRISHNQGEPLSSIPTRTGRSTIPTMSNFTKSQSDSLEQSHYDKLLTKESHLDDLSDPSDPSTSSRQRSKHTTGFSYLYSANVDSGIGLDNSTGQMAQTSTLIRTRRPQRHTMVGQIVKMFEKRLQFKPVPNY
ncbi:hypothetical protein BgiBS90_027692 [Biomphalaria glabrata]|nr:hypothetical protein BgiBS90_027692 [Biomphalaria glabrata]